ncbi:MAG: hypothetical protein M3459_12835 [Actinomycetota bacterium]|nr:hypothetical protein [Actinomycetota bacterium]
MEPPVRGHQLREAREDLANVLVVHVMQEAVDEDEVRSTSVGWNVVSEIGDHEVAPMTLAGVLDVGRVDVEPEVAGRREVVRVGPRTAPHVEDVRDAAEVVVPENRSELALGQRGLRESIDERLLDRADAEPE